MKIIEWEDLLMNLDNMQTVKKDVDNKLFITFSEHREFTIEFDSTKERDDFYNRIKNLKDRFL